MRRTFLAMTAGALVLAACANKEPATNVVTQAEAALASLRDDARSYAPEELKAAETTLADMKQDLAEGEYKSVTNAVPQFNEQVQTLHSAVVQKQTLAVAAQNEWDSMKDEMPKAIDAIQVRVDSLKGRRLPKEISKEAYEAAKTDLETLKATWSEASAAAAAGQTQEAADKGRIVQTKVQELQSELGMTPALAQATMAPPAGQDISPAQ